MDRRAFISMVGGSFLAPPLVVEVQQSRRVWRIGQVDYAAPDPTRLALWRASQDRLRANWDRRMSSFNRDG